jgi:hypothetical protein
MTWHGGTLGTVAGRDNVAGLMTLVVTSIPDLHADVQDIFGQDDKVVVRLVVSGTLRAICWAYTAPANTSNGTRPTSTT